MKQLALTIALIGLMIPGTPNSWAENPDSHTSTYVATMTGVDCGGCKRSVNYAFRTLDGVLSVKISKGNRPNTQSVTVVSTSSDLTQEDAVNSLGRDAARYVILSWELIESASNTETDRPRGKYGR